MSEINRISLVASRSVGPRNDPNSLDPRAIEATPDGSLKIAVKATTGVVRLGSAAIAQSAATTVYTSDGYYRNVKLKVCNNEGVNDHTLKIYHVVPDGSAANANMIERCLVRAGWAGTEIDLAGLAPYETIQAQVVDSGSDLDVTVTVYGEKYA